MLALYVIYATIIEFKASQGRPLDLTVATALGMLALVVAFSLPDTIIVSADGLQQISWLWKIKRIRWTEIAQINTGEKSRTVMIRGTDGTKIVHTHQLPDRPRLLMEIKNHCGEKSGGRFPAGAGRVLRFAI